MTIGSSDDPSPLWAHVRRGHELFQAGRFDEALAAYDLAPELAEAWLGRARTLKHLQQTNDAVVAYRQALARGGDAEIIEFSLASLGAAPVPTAAPGGLIRSTYDLHSEHYDSHMVGTLKYRIPDHLLAELNGKLPSRPLDVLDLGCGTGLMGARVRSMARTLIGVDISAKMLERARQRRIYDSLICGELFDFLRTQGRRFDLVVAADVLVYFGDLSSIFRQVRKALTEQGVFGFSVEASEERDFVLKPSLRYAHSRAHVRRAARAHDFALRSIKPKALRREGGRDVTGYIAVLRCT